MNTHLADQAADFLYSFQQEEDSSPSGDVFTLTEAIVINGNNLIPEGSQIQVLVHA